jgi:hypothetical protein
MKNLLLTTALALFTSMAVAQNPNNIKIMPDASTVCFETEVYLYVAGQSFVPTSYLWSNGATTPTLKVTSSGTYTVSVTGTVGNTNQIRTIQRTRTYNVKSKPTITNLTELWVCKNDTVKLMAEPGYDSYSWNTGTNGTYFEKEMNKGGGNTPSLDTLNIFYTSGITGVCTVESEVVELRGIRKPNGVGQFFCGKTNLSLSGLVAPGTVLDYIYPVFYESVFTEVADPTNVITYVTPSVPGNPSQPVSDRRIPLSILEDGKTYSVVTRPIINNIAYCFGDPCIIGINASGNRFANFGEYTDEVKTYRITDMSGRVVMERKANMFEREWLTNLSSQLFIVSEIKDNGEITTKLEAFRQ